MKEIWKDIEGYEGLYQVSNLGNIKSCYSRRYKSEPIMKLVTHHTGYLVVTLCKNGKRRQCRVHTLVAKAFIPNPNNYPIVNHIDGNKANNHSLNLEWTTYKANTNHAISIGLMNPKDTPKRMGKANLFSKPVIQYDLSGNFVKLWDCQSDAARSFGCDPRSISAAVDNSHKTCMGFMWRSFDEGNQIPKHIEPTESHRVQRPIYQCSLDGTIIKVWSGLYEIDKQSPYDRHAVSDCVRGKRKAYKDYLWRF